MVIDSDVRIVNSPITLFKIEKRKPWSNGVELGESYVWPLSDQRHSFAACADPVPTTIAFVRDDFVLFDQGGLFMMRRQIRVCPFIHFGFVAFELLDLHLVLSLLSSHGFYQS
jgi:hypothetical protein